MISLSSLDSLDISIGLPFFMAAVLVVLVIVLCSPFLMLSCFGIGPFDWEFSYKCTHAIVLPIIGVYCENLGIVL